MDRHAAQRDEKWNAHDECAPPQHREGARDRDEQREDGERGRSHGVKAKIPSVTLGGDIARFGFAIFLASAFGAVQVFVIPRRLDLQTFGEYRLFLLYVGYIGLMHFGLADGAFLRWAGRPMPAIRHEVRRVSVWLLAIDAGLIVLALIAAAFAGGRAGVYLIALAAAALTMNFATLVAYALQAGGDFRGAGRVAALAPGIFVAAVIVLPLRSLAAVLAAYVASFAVATVAGAVRLRSTDEAPRDARDIDLRTMLRGGLPVLGANITASLSQYGDRILVSIVVPITTFALYGFASSVMVTASSATQTLSRVALSHAAREPAEGDARAVLIGGFYDLIAAGFGVAMAGVPFFEHLVARLLPAYVTALPIVRALIVGSPFWVAIHVVLVGTLQSYGMVRRQFTLEVIGLVLVAVLCGAALAAHAPLWVVAAASSAAAVAAWLIGIAVAHRAIPSIRMQPAQRFAPIVAAQCAAAVLVLMLPLGWIAQSLLYVALGSLPTFAAARAAKRHGW